jgi:hypothetical protein
VVGRGATTHFKSHFVTKSHKAPRTWTASCEHGNEPSGSIKGGEFLDKLSDCQLLKKDSDPWNVQTAESTTVAFLYVQRASHTIIRVIEDIINAYKMLVGKPRRTWEDNIKTDLWEIG